MLICMDGPAVSGKGTQAKKLADALGFTHIDSGLLYRAVASKVLEVGEGSFVLEELAIHIANTLTPEDLKRDDLRSEKVGNKAAAISGIQAVRDAINASLRRMIAEAGDVVMDGRAGAYEFPQAEIKIFLTASAEVRAFRRCLHLARAGEKYDLIKVYEDLVERDRSDQEREVSPLKPASDAHVINNTEMDIDRTFAAVYEHCRNRLMFA